MTTNRARGRGRCIGSFRATSSTKARLFLSHTRDDRRKNVSGLCRFMTKFCPWFCAAPRRRRRVAVSFFPTAVGTKWSGTTWGNHFQRAVSRAKLEDLRTYDLGSTFASHLIQNGASLRAVADLLGHSGLGMVMRYAYLAPSHLKAAIDTLSSPKATHSDTILT